MLASQVSSNLAQLQTLEVINTSCIDHIVLTARVVDFLQRES